MKAHIGPNGKLLHLWQTPKIMQLKHSYIPDMFDYSADPVVHLPLLKSCMVQRLLSA